MGLINGVSCPPIDNYHPENSHVILDLIRRFHEAKISQAPKVLIWGAVNQLHKFLFVEDLAQDSVIVMNLAQSEYELQKQPMLSHINVGFGRDISIKELAQAISDVVGFRGYLEFDSSKPDGSPRKLTDSSRLNALGWSAKVGLVESFIMSYQDFLTQLNHSLVIQF